MHKSHLSTIRKLLSNHSERTSGCSYSFKFYGYTSSDSWRAQHFNQTSSKIYEGLSRPERTSCQGGTMVRLRGKWEKASGPAHTDAAYPTISPLQSPEYKTEATQDRHCHNGSLSLRSSPLWRSPAGIEQTRAL